MPTLTKSAPASARKQETVAVYHVAGAHLNGVAIGARTIHSMVRLLPLGITLGGVDAQHVRAGLDQGGHTLCVVTGVDAGAHHIALVGYPAAPAGFLYGCRSPCGKRYISDDHPRRSEAGS